MCLLEVQNRTFYISRGVHVLTGCLRNAPISSLPSLLRNKYLSILEHLQFLWNSLYFLLINCVLVQKQSGSQCHSQSELKLLWVYEVQALKRCHSIPLFILWHMLPCTHGIDLISVGAYDGKPSNIFSRINVNNDCIYRYVDIPYTVSQGTPSKLREQMLTKILLQK